MKIVCIGGGPAGLTFALLMKQRWPQHEITVYERNRPYDTFGWGVVFSDATLDTLRRWDAPTANAIEAAFNHWDDIELHFKGRRIRSGGHGFVGIGRKRLLNLLQARCEELGVRLVFEQEVGGDEDFPDADLIIASDGVNSRVRAAHAAVFKPDIVTRPNRFIWLGSKRRFEAFTFDFQRTEHGWFQAHVYQFEPETSTFIVECPESVWLAHGLDKASTDDSIAFCERLFAGLLQGEPLLSNARHLRGSAWLNFQRIVCQQWWLRNRHGCPVVLMGDAVHTAHFAIGSGTKLALEDAIELTAQFERSGHAAKSGEQTQHMDAVLTAYQAARHVETLRIQNAAWNAMEWFEVCGQRYCDQLEPEQFMYSLLTRSQRISHENLRLRDKAWLEGYEAWFEQRAHTLALAAPKSGLNATRTSPSSPVTSAALAAATAPQPVRVSKPTPPMFTPVQLRSLRLHNRVVVSPMAQYSAHEGVPGDYHLVHLGARATGGAGLVMAEMTCVSADARITPACPGLWNDEQEQAWRRIVQWVHTNSAAKMGLQLGHAGPKGSTCVPWQGAGIDQPLESGAWPLVGASAQAYLHDGPLPQALDEAGMARIQAQFVAATERAARAGFDWLELHAAHGYLLSAFISPLTNQRTDGYGGSLANRLRWPVAVFKAMRAVWPQHLPMSVRISAHDWVAGGIEPTDAVQIAKAFKAAGADVIDCSSGQVSADQKPTYGRMYQTPFADRIRQEAGIATMAVGAISEADHCNAIIAAGRADLCAVGRPHLANPAWTLTEAARIGYQPMPWPLPYQAAKPQLESLFARAGGVAPQRA